LRILDINLRPPFWDKEILKQSLALANVLKLNDAELPVLKDLLGWRRSDDELLKHLHKEFSLQLIALTRGADGARISKADGEMSDLPGQNTAIVNTVGAGDCYTAALTIGLLRDLPLGKINAWANRVAAFVCTQPGAAPDLPASLRAP
jgi:fructokinase